MTTIKRHVKIDASSDKVWAALADFGNIAIWNPAVRNSHLTSSETEGVGMSRECQLVPTGTVQELVTGWTEGKSLTVEIVDFKNVPAMRTAIAEFTLEPRGEQTDAFMTMNYEVGLGILGDGMNSMMMKRQFQKALTGLLAGLKHHVETGESVDRRSDIPMEAVLVS